MLASEEAVTAWTDRVRAEYREMPGLTLTRWQMRRFWLLDECCDSGPGCEPGDFGSSMRLRASNDRLAVPVQLSPAGDCA